MYTNFKVFSDRKIYWTDIGNSQIEMSYLDGSGRQTILDTDIQQPNGISLDFQGKCKDHYYGIPTRMQPLKRIEMIKAQILYVPCLSKTALQICI